MAIDVPIRLQDEFSRQYNQILGNINKSAASVDNTMKSIGTAIGTAFSIGAIASFMKTAASANAEVARMDQALSNSGMSQYRGELLETSKALRDKTAVDDDDIVKLQAQLVAYTGNIDAVRKLTPAILDLAAGTGMSVEAAGKLVGKSQEGTEGLKRLGITIGDTATDEERLAKITEEVTKRYGGMAEAFGNTDAGGIQKLSNAMEDLEETTGNVFLKILQPSLPGILFLIDKFGWLIEKSVGSIKVLTTLIVTGLVAPFAAVEAKLNELGITSSHTFQNMMASGIRQTVQASNELIHGTDAAAKSIGTVGTVSRNTAGEITSVSDKIKHLQSELDKLTPGTQAYMDVLIKLNAVKRESNRLEEEAAIRVQYAAGIEISESEKKFASFIRGQKTYELESTTSMQQNLEIQNKWSLAFAQVDSENKEKNQKKELARLTKNLEIQKGLYGSFTNAIGTTYQSVLGDKFNELLGNQNSVLEKFLGTVAQNLIAWSAAQISDIILNAIIARTTAAASLAALSAEMAGVLTIAAPTALAVNVASFGAAGAAAAISFGTAAAAQLTAQGAVSLFHEGGTMGADGGRIPLRSDERPAILKVGETVRTPEQERALGGGGTTIHFHFPNAIISSKRGLQKMVQQGMRELGVTDINKYFVNQRSGIALGAA